VIPPDYKQWRTHITNKPDISFSSRYATTLTPKFAFKSEIIIPTKTELFSLEYVRYFYLFAFYEQFKIPNMDNQIAHAALNTFTESTGIKTTWKQNRTRSKDPNLNGLVRFSIFKHPIEIPAEVKNNVLAAHLPDLHRRKEKLKNLIVLTDYIMPKEQEQLKKLGVFFIDIAGNAFIQMDSFFVMVEGKKAKPKAVSDARAFSKGGIKVIFQLFLNETLLNLPMRQIAAAADVSLDTVHKTINALKAMRYLIPLNKNTLIWQNKKDLLTRWITEYDTRLKPGLFMHRFDFLHEEDFDQWKQLKFKNELTCWGAEPAGELLINNLKPIELTLYTLETDMQLTKHYRILPKKAGAIVVYKRFWPQLSKEEKTAPPLLVYADLVNTGDRRNIEIAQTIFDEYLQDKF
jgi:hypothetical protein